jgi:methylated-DNA-protein-cysteine methyltransferase-like protein
MTAFTNEVIKVVKSIPPGRVLSYGAVAELAGNARAARGVVFILRSRSKIDNLPWHRVVGKTGQVRIKDIEGYLLQKHLLELENVVVSDSGLIDMDVYRMDL